MRKLLCMGALAVLLPVLASARFAISLLLRSLRSLRKYAPRKSSRQQNRQRTHTQKLSHFLSWSLLLLRAVETAPNADEVRTPRILFAPVMRSQRG
jgi:hypothetical protein